jgi:hypothetical protein
MVASPFRIASRSSSANPKIPADTIVSASLTKAFMAPITKMRIHRFGGNEVLQADTIEPSLPDAGQVLVAVHAASANPVDFKIRSGKYPAMELKLVCRPPPRFRLASSPANYSQMQRNMAKAGSPSGWSQIRN